MSNHRRRGGGDDVPIFNFEQPRIYAPVNAFGYRYGFDQNYYFPPLAPGRYVAGGGRVPILRPEQPRAYVPVNGGYNYNPERYRPPVAPGRYVTGNTNNRQRPVISEQRTEHHVSGNNGRENGRERPAYNGQNHYNTAPNRNTNNCVRPTLIVWRSIPGNASNSASATAGGQSNNSPPARRSLRLDGLSYAKVAASNKGHSTSSEAKVPQPQQKSEEAKVGTPPPQWQNEGHALDPFRFGLPTRNYYSYYEDNNFSLYSGSMNASERRTDPLPNPLPEDQQYKLWDSNIRIT